ncbi:MAG: LPS assembly lipoprotein LptE [Spirochaetia bacterium]|nr:LPS assembly lipoprotein LptE [Spirochaetia bacterium]
MTVRHLIIVCILGSGFVPFACQSADVKEENKLLLSIDGDERVSRKYKSIYIHNFINESYTGELTGELKEMLIQKMSAQQRFKIETDKTNADVWLYGKIEYYSLNPRNIDPFGRVTRYNMTIFVSVWVRPNSKLSGEDIYDKQNVRFDTFYVPEQPPFETEFTARQRLLDGLCDRIVKAVITGWYSDLKTSEELGYDPTKQKK